MRVALPSSSHFGSVLYTKLYVNVKHASYSAMSGKLSESQNYHRIGQHNFCLLFTVLTHSHVTWSRWNSVWVCSSSSSCRPLHPSTLSMVWGRWAATSTTRSSSTTWPTSSSTWSSTKSFEQSWRASSRNRLNYETSPCLKIVPTYYVSRRGGCP